MTTRSRSLHTVYRRATAHYTRAVELSGGSLESRLGLSWSLLYDGHRERALAELEALERDYPEAPEVDEALAFAQERGLVGYRPWVSLTGHVYGNHPGLERGFGFQGGLGLLVAEHVLFGASYGFARIALDPTVTGSMGAGNGPGPGGQTVEAERVDQHQLHASIGPVWTAGGVLLQYGFLHSEGEPGLHAVGTSMRWSPWGDIVFAGSVTFETDATRPRLEPSWKLPVHEHVWLRPAAAIQIDDGVLPVGMLTTAVHGSPGSVWVGGKYGRERRPAYLDVPVVFNVSGDIHWGAWLGGRVELPAGFAVLASYEVHGVEVETASSTVDTRAHYITAGLAFSHP